MFASLRHRNARLFFLGLLFIGVTLFLPEGVVGLAARFRARRQRTAAVEHKS